MNFSVSITLEDYQEAMKLHRSQKLTRRLCHYLPYFILLFAAAAIFVFLAFFDTRQSPPSISESVCAVLFFAMALWLPIGRRQIIRKRFGEVYPPGQTDKTVSVDIDDDRVVYSHPGFIEAKYSWSTILDTVQNNKLTLLYVSKNCFLLIPVTLLLAAERSEFNALIARHLARS
jgi:hypothetical protein